MVLCPTYHDMMLNVTITKFVGASHPDRRRVFLKKCSNYYIKSSYNVTKIYKKKQCILYI